ncbi:MAG TPA: cytochrome P450 [Methylomirabilota bacterium]|jgi:cytochrome P450/NADPH-cytochrome P450 reductase|nr:cytochrome P450 [Methylomirabilota bacterium]
MASRNIMDPIPHPPRTFLVGNLLSLSATTPVQDMMKLARQYGPIYWLDMMGKPVVVVSGFSLVDELCDEARFDKSVRGALRKVRNFAGDGLFTAYTQEPNWAKAHNILLPNFGQRAMQGYHPMMLDIAEQLVLKWERLNADEEVDVVRDMTSLTLDTIGLCGFDYRFNSFYRDTNHPFVDAIVGALAGSMEQAGRLPLEDLIRKDRDRKLRADIRFMNEMVDRIIKERRESGDDVATKPDLLSYMLSGVDKKTGERLDDLNIRYQIITFLIAGHETTSGLLSFAIHALLNHPQVLARACDEVDRVLGPDPAVKPTYAQVNQLGYISQVLDETLRLWPTAPVFALSPYKDTVIGDRYKMRKNSQILVLVPMLHRDREIWGEQAEVFNPDNFSREAQRSRPANAFKPFGNGQRACIGRQFAMQEATLVLGLILQRLKLVDHTRYTLKIKETLTIKPDGLKIKVRKRTDRGRTIVTPAVTAERPAVARSTPAPSGPPPAHHTPLLVLYGSNLGTAEGIARLIAEAGTLNGFAATVAPLDDYAGRLPREGAVMIATSSYNGTPPDNALGFCDWLRAGRLAADSLRGVSYAVFGCGNRDWASTFQAIPRLIDQKLEEFGARRLYPRGEGDARDDFDGQFQNWYEPLWPAVASELGIDLAEPDAAAAGPLYAVELVAGRETSPFVDSLAARPMRVSVNRELHAKDGLHPSERSTRHLELELPDDVAYRAGDHLGVIAHNAEPLVARVASRFAFERDTVIRLRQSGLRQAVLPVDQAIPIRRLLADYVELQEVATRKQLQTMAEHTECPFTRPKLLAVAGDETRYKEAVMASRKSIIDLLDEFPACQLPFNVYLEMLPPLRPRYYSISSSPLVQARRCSITVAVVEAPARSGRGTFQGVCSNYLRLQPEGAVVHAFVKDTKSAFRLPEDARTPMIMVGPGTGLAPFRGFLQERAALKARGRPVGPSLLFFGCRHPDQDFIYSDELERFGADGVTRLFTCFSRVAGQKKTYVQDQILAAKDDVWAMIQDGAAIYVCGDASRMAPDVRLAFATVYRDKTGGDAEAAERWIDEMTGRNRYLVDVWAAT